MKLTLVFIPFLLLYNFVSAQNNEPVPHSTLISFMDTLQVKDTMKVNNLSSSNGLADVFEDTIRLFHDTLFTAEDKRFIRKQLIVFRTREWTDSDRIAGVSIIPQGVINSYAINGEVGWKKFIKKYGKGYKVVSFPLFTANMSAAVVAITYHIGRYTEGSLHLYKKVKGIWKDAKVYSVWKG
jgi:hypothetical protein